MQLTVMNSDSNFLSTIDEVDQQEEEEEEEEDDGFEVIPSKPNKPLTHSPSPRPTSSSIPPDRALNQKFHVAALTGDFKTLQELLTKLHLPIDCRDKENSTALLLSCARGHYSCAEYLLANGADPNARRITGASPPLLRSIIPSYSYCGTSSE